MLRRLSLVSPLRQQSPRLSTPPPSPSSAIPSSLSLVDLRSAFWRATGRRLRRHRSYVVAEDAQEARAGQAQGCDSRGRGFLSGIRSAIVGKNKSIVQRLLPTQFSNESQTISEGQDCRQSPSSSNPSSPKPKLNITPPSPPPLSTSLTHQHPHHHHGQETRPEHGHGRVVRLHVYRINDRLGFYHTGVVFLGREFTFCQFSGICQHNPRQVAFATFLGAVNLGHSEVDEGDFENILEDMRLHGFGRGDYDVMAKSCNSFTAELSRRLLGGRLGRYPAGVLQQSRLADWLSPLARALDIVPGQPRDETAGAARRTGSWNRGSFASVKRQKEKRKSL